MSARDEVWVTGLGAASPAGIGCRALSALLHERRSAVGPGNGGPWRVGQCPALPADATTRRLGRDGRLFVIAAEEAWRDAELSDRAAADPRRCCVIEGSSLGPLPGAMTAACDRAARGLPARPTDLVRFMTGAGGAAFAQLHGVEGMVYQISAGSVAAAFAIGEAARRLWSGDADIVVTGGAESPIQDDVLATFAAAGILAAAGSDGRCRPFDRDRSGTVLGEGAGVLILERAAHARARGARPRAIIAGVGASAESAGMVGPAADGRGVAAAIHGAMVMHGSSDIGWIKAHGTGTRANDLAECRGLRSIFGPDLAALPLTSLKATIGHALGASAAIETVGALLALESGFIPPTCETETVDTALLPCTVALEPRPTRATSVLLLAESFGGRCAALVVRMA